jgi:starch phosphorylase
LWRATHHSPKAFLKRMDQKRVNEAADDPVFLGTMNRVLSAFDSYHAEPRLQLPGKPPLQATDLIAYFCAEFGFHESLPIYSGGLGILAGDHCKGASDMRLPFVAVGLLYRQGYFHQTIDREGNQTAHYADNDFDDMPIEPVRNEDGSEMHIGVDFPGRTVWAKIWRARVGNNSLYLLDTQLRGKQRIRPPHCAPALRRRPAHPHRAGNPARRRRRPRARRAQAAPTVWHINEGHAAFLVLERIRNLVAQDMPFAAALEAAAANTVFTTHTPVPAGHDHFADDMVLHYFGGFCKAAGLDGESLLGMGRVGGGVGGGEFNMTALALRGSRFHNGVSRIHGDVSSRICGDMWPQITAAENRWTTSPTRCTRRPSSPPTGTKPSTATSASAGSTASPTRAAGTGCTAFPTRSSGASASRSRPSCCTWCIAGSVSSTCATRVPRRTSTACCVSPTRTIRPC